jgi:hypothetical protein
MTKRWCLFPWILALAAPLGAASVTATPSPTTLPTVLPTVSPIPTLPTVLPTLTLGPTLQPTATAVPTSTPNLTVQPTQATTQSPSTSKTPLVSPTAVAPAVLGSNLFRPSKGPLSVSWRPLKSGLVSVQVFSLEGVRVRTLPTAPPVGALAGAWAQTAWDGRDDQGRDVSSGLYLVSIRGGGIQSLLKVDLLR